MTEVISVRFRGGSKTYYFDPKGVPVRAGDSVIVQTAQGMEFATCTQGNHEVQDEAIVKPLSAMVRRATENDFRVMEYNRKREREAFGICEGKIADHGLEMKLVSVSVGFDSNKIVFYFTADGRVDFRELVRDLASVFRARIELRQIGVRDEARMLGGFGICGKPFCCAQFLDEFQPVSIKMAKTQNLSLNPTKISGTCGRLMCCLKYEQGAYEDAVKRCPKQESFVECPDGVGTVSAVNLLKEQVKVRLEDSTEQPQSYFTDEIRVVRPGKGKRPEGYTAPPKAELEKLRTKEGDRVRSGGKKTDGPADLEAVLERYLGDAGQQKQPDGQRQGNRRTRGGQNRPPAQGQNQRQQSQNQGQSKPRQQSAPPQRPSQSKQPAPQRGVQLTSAQAVEAKAAQNQGQNYKRRYRSHHRRGKPGGGQSAPPAQS